MLKVGENGYFVCRSSRHVPKSPNSLHLYNGDLTYVGTFPVNLRMALIFTDFPTGSGSATVLCWKSVYIKSIPKSTGEVPM